MLFNRFCRFMIKNLDKSANCILTLGDVAETLMACQQPLQKFFSNIYTLQKEETMLPFFGFT